MALIYTHNSSPRKFKRVIKTKSFYKAKQEQDKLLKSMGMDPNRRLRRPRVSIPLDQVGKLKRYAPVAQLEEQLICNHQAGSSNLSGGTKPVSNVKLEVSKQYTVAPAYNKGPSMVVGRKDIKDIGR